MVLEPTSKRTRSTTNKANYTDFVRLFVKTPTRFNLGRLAYVVRCTCMANRGISGSFPGPYAIHC